MDRKRSDTSSKTNEKTVEIFQARNDERLRYRYSGRDRKEGADARILNRQYIILPQHHVNLKTSDQYCYEIEECSNVGGGDPMCIIQFFLLNPMQTYTHLLLVNPPLVFTDKSLF